MKKILCILLIICSLVVVAGCGKTETAENGGGETEQTPVKTQSEEIKEFMDNYVDTDERPVAVMIDNDDKNSRPQAGLDEAYLVYELTVEGGSTRFMAVFRGTDTEKIGPVRSSRHYFLDYVLENDAIYTHFGWSPKAITDIPALGVKNVNGLINPDANIFWREEKFKGDWHSAYTSIAKITDMAKSKGYALTTSEKNGIVYSESYFDLDSKNPAKKVVLNYSSIYTTGYEYNEETMLYEKTINGSPHLMQNGNTVTFKNIIVELIADTSLGDGSPRRNINTTGTGKGYYFTNGSYEEITWSKASRGANTVYKKADGTELEVNPGKTIVNIFNPASKITIE